MTLHTYDEVHAASLAYFEGDELATDVFAGKYALQDLNEAYHELTPLDMHRRTARELFRIEKGYQNPLGEEEIFELLSSWKVVLQGGPMSAVGNPYQIQSMSNCFVVGSPHDSYGGIMRTDEEEAQIMKRRGGVGIDISTIRPRGLSAANAARTTDGIAVFMDRYSDTCREVGQGGRRGACMLTLDVHHPEILTFVNVKRDPKRVTGANVSVRISDEFMHAVQAGGTYRQRFPVNAGLDHYVIDREVDAREMWNNIVSAMHDCSEPGMLFWDTVHRNGPSETYVRSCSSNPCGEQCLPPDSVCLLTLMNLSKFVINPFLHAASFDFDAFASATFKAQRLLDDLLDLELEAIDRIVAKIDADPEPEDVKRVERDLWCRIKRNMRDYRRVGLGITALADVFAMLGMPYASDRSIELTEQIYRTLTVNSYRSSIALARERGAFPLFSRDVERDHPFIDRVLVEDAIELRDEYERHGRRNVSCTTTPPAGSVSIMTRTTSGCEPLFFMKSVRKRKVMSSDSQARVDEVDAMGDRWQRYDLTHAGITAWSQVTGKTDPTECPYAGSTAEEIDPMKKVDLQAAAQRWVCNAISVTHNLPEGVSNETISGLCMHAWETGCKGITVYRKNSRSAIIGEATSRSSDQPTLITECHAPKRPKELVCDVHRVSIKGAQYLVLVGLLNGEPYEIFAGLSQCVEVPRKTKFAVIIKNGKKDGIVTYNLRIPLADDDQLVLKDIVSLFDNPEHGALTRMISLSMRHGVPTQFLVEQLKKDKRSDLTSFSGVIARVLKGYIKDGTEVTDEKKCPECGEKLVYQAGCVGCTSCSWSKC